MVYVGANRIFVSISGNDAMLLSCSVVSFFDGEKCGFSIYCRVLQSLR